MKTTVRSRSLKTVFSIFLIVTFIILLTSYAVLSFNLTRTTNGITSQYLLELSDRVGTLSSQLFSAAKDTAEYLKYSQYVRQFMSSTDDLELIALSQHVADLLNKLTVVNSDIETIILFRKNHRVITYSKTNVSMQERSLWEEYRNIFETGELCNRFFRMYSSDGELSYLAYASSVVSLESRQHTQVVGTVVVVLNSGALGNLLELPIVDENSSLMIVDNKNTVLFSSLPTAVIGQPAEIPGSAQIIPLPDSGWSLVCNLQLNQQQTAQYASILKNTLFQAVLLVSLFAAFLIAMERWIIQPILGIHREVSGMSRRMLPASINVRSSFRELESIIGAINDLNMVQENTKKDLLETQQRLFDAEISRRASDIYALENQVNPHFMRNTLQCISGIAIQSDVPLISEIVDGLSVIYEYSLHEFGIVPLADELSIVDEYARIVDIRFGGQFEWYTEVPEEIRFFYIPKMTLQPIVENAIYHGLRNSGSNVWLKAWIDQKYLHIQVRDDGCGIDPETVAQLRKVLDNPKLRAEATAQRHVGLVNIYRRMLLYSEECKLHLESKSGSGTTVSLVFPLKGE